MNEPKNQELVEFADNVVSTALSAKRLLCEFAEGPADGIPLLVWQTKDGTQIVPLPTPDGDISLPEIMEVVLKEVWAGLGTPIHGSIVVEAFMGEVGSFDEIKRGELEKRFKENPKSVSECMTVLTFNTAGQFCHSVLEYTYDDKGMPKFADESVANNQDDSVIGGEMVTIVGQFLKFINGQ